MMRLFKRKKDVLVDKDYTLELLKGNLEGLTEAQGGSYKTFNILRIGRLLEGTAYYHEVEAYYNCVGFEVEYEANFDLGGEFGVTELEKNVGFFSVWIGKTHPMAPLSFEESYQELGKVHKFHNGLGDHIEIKKEL